MPAIRSTLRLATPKLFERSLPLLCAVLYCVIPAAVHAHEGDGIDAGFAHVIAITDADGATTVEVRIIETDDCAKFAAGSVRAERDTTAVRGPVVSLEPCVFRGSLSLPEQGRWQLTVQLVYATAPTMIQIPVGFSGEEGRFERTDWLHVDVVFGSGMSDGAWYRPTGTLSFAVIGLLIGTVIELVRRRLVARAAG